MYCRPRWLRPEIYAAVKAAFNELLARGIISRSDSAWSSPLHVVPKKDDSWRPVGDYRALNNLTARDTYPLPHLHTFADSLFGTSIYSKVDLKETFLQIPVHPNDIAKTNITTPFGAFQYNYMSYGPSGASQSFQRFIDTVLRDLCVIDSIGISRPVTVFAYIDEILIASSDEAAHKLDLRALFVRLSEYGLRINLHKCAFGVSTLKFLGHKLSKEGLAPLPEKVVALQQYSRPETAKDLRRYLGMINFYRRFVPRAAQTLAPLYDLLKIACKRSSRGMLEWTHETVSAFEKSKSDLLNATMLAYPAPGARIYLAADASDNAVGAVLQQQLPDGTMQPLGFLSRRLDPAQIKWSIFGRELLAVYLGVHHFAYFLEGAQFIIQTDHQALISAAASAKIRDIARVSAVAILSNYAC